MNVFFDCTLNKARSVVAERLYRRTPGLSVRSAGTSDRSAHQLTEADLVWADKVVVFDRMRENLRKFKAMPLEQLTDLSINETLNRSLGTSMTLLLSSLPLALFGGDALSGFALVLLFGIFISASSSVFIAAPIVLYSGRTRLRRDVAPPSAPPAVRAT